MNITIFFLFLFFALIAAAIRAYDENYAFGATAGIIFLLLGIYLMALLPLEINTCESVINNTYVNVNNYTMYEYSVFCDSCELSVSNLYKEGFGISIILLGLYLCLDCFQEHKRRELRRSYE